MNENIDKLIDAIKYSNSSNNIVLTCTVISCLIALISLIISLIVLFLQLKDRLLRKKVMGYIYQFFAPTYIVTQLPTTKKIIKELKTILFSEKDIFDTIIVLNKENIISAVGDTCTNLPDLKWKPNTNYYKSENERK